MNRQIVRSFDLFDTLVARRCLHPHDVFKEMEIKSGIPGFAAARISAEAAIFANSYTFDDIYDELYRTNFITADQISIVKSLELEIEWANFFPIKENCDKVNISDIIISDMYLPYDFVQEIISKICHLPFNPLFLTSHGKRNGSIWAQLVDMFDIRQHIGDNELTDVDSPRQNNVPAELTRSAHLTEIETLLISRGFDSVARIIREARLTTWDDNSTRRRGQIAQIQGNFTFLFISSLFLIRECERNGWKTLLFSSRDCDLWLQLFESIKSVTEIDVQCRYFYTSRVAKSNASPYYIDYFKHLSGDTPSSVVDICGTGWSTQQLIEKSMQSNADMFIAHHLDIPSLLERYQSIEKVSFKTPIYCIDNLSGDNNVLEMMNCAPHPMVEDVIKIFGQFTPIYSPTIYDDAHIAIIDSHHLAFKRAVSLVYKLEQHDFDHMLQTVDLELIQEIYNYLASFRDELTPLFEQQRTEEGAVWRMLNDKNIDDT